MNKYCLETNDEINIFKIKDLNKLLYKYVPFPEYAGEFITELFNEIEKLNDMLTELVNNIEKYDIAEYIGMVANIHYKLTVLHPFNDGNGRISRAFMNWLLRLKRLCPIYIDSNNKNEYLNALNKIDRESDSTDLQIIIIKSIIKTMAELHESWN